MEKLNLKKFEKAVIEKEAANKIKGGDPSNVVYCTKEWGTQDYNADAAN